MARYNNPKTGETVEAPNLAEANEKFGAIKEAPEAPEAPAAPASGTKGKAKAPKE